MITDDVFLDLSILANFARKHSWNEDDVERVRVWLSNNPPCWLSEYVILTNHTNLLHEIRHNRYRWAQELFAWTSSKFRHYFCQCALYNVFPREIVDLIVLYEFSSDHEDTWPESMLPPPPPPGTTCNLFSFPCGYHPSIWLRSRNRIHPKSLVPMPRDWFIQAVIQAKSFWCKMRSVMQASNT